PDKPGTAVVFATPIKGARQIRAARKAGFATAKSLHNVRVEGADKPGQGANITSALAAAKINLRGLSAASIGKRFVVHVAVDTNAAAAKAVSVLKKL
ncbi:MAG: amino acid-binding protein, partial [Deltaproteobacteria bacterium RIFOXYB2_FULL_66_7]